MGFVNEEVQSNIKNEHSDDNPFGNEVDGEAGPARGEPAPFLLSIDDP
jgi:hypothetical protein